MSGFLLLGCCLVGAAVRAQVPPPEARPSPPLLGDMLAPPEISTMLISPDGKHVVGIGNASLAPVVFVLDLTDFTTRILRMPAATSRYYWRMPTSVHWIADDLVAVDFNSEQSEAISLDGKRIATLGERFIRRMARPGPGGDDWVLVFGDLRRREMELVNARTGERHGYDVKLPGELFRWAFDAAGHLRAVTMIDTAMWTERTRISNWYREDEQSPWQLMEEGSLARDDYWIPLRALPEPHMLAVLSRHDRDTWAVFRYDTVTKSHVRLMAGRDNEDVVGTTGIDDSRFDSVATNGMKPSRDWFDARWAGLQASVDAELPGSVNTLTGNPAGKVLVMSYSDVDPGRWLLLDVPSMSLRTLGASQSKIDPKRMRPMETLQYKARDGLAVNAYLTRPVQPSPQPAPMVVLIHGGPNLRDHWMWNAEVQILASYGYVVFQPQFRGSEGFGRRFEEAGFGQWGLAMQDDITDGVAELVAKKIADPARICIYGASYGGYAALWGVVKTPTLYRCGVSFAGVSDLQAMASHSIFDDSNAISREIELVRVGDPDKARAQLEAVSPLRHVEAVRVPLLIAHGEEDERVLFSQSKRMVDALRKNGKDVEWMPFEREGHGFYWVNDERDYLTAVLSFLQRHIGEPP